MTVEEQEKDLKIKCGLLGVSGEYFYDLNRNIIVKSWKNIITMYHYAKEGKNNVVSITKLYEGENNRETDRAFTAICYTIAAV